jgi:uncharacterized protein with NRDE domain
MYTKRRCELLCLILFSWQSHPRYSLIVAANRDEFHQRPTEAAAIWQDNPLILAGRDLQAGGTWLGITRTGRFAAITNYREPLTPEIPQERSRGCLVRDFLGGDRAPLVHAGELISEGPSYQGFNLLLGAPGSLVYVSNRSAEPFEVSAGSHGLSNHLLDTDWPKVHSGRERLDELLKDQEVNVEDLFALLADRVLTPGRIPQNLETRLAPERLMKHYFIVSPEYGTRSSTVVLIGRNGGVKFMERQFDPEGKETGERSFEW